MISTFVMYSPDRKPQFEQMVECMRDMDLYEQCQKVIVCDGDRCNVQPDGWEVVPVPREDDVFSWSSMWAAGVDSAKHEVVMYLDSDRVLPRDYLPLVLERIDDGMFLFTGQLFNFLKPVETSLVKTYRDSLTPATLMENYYLYRDFLWYDPRFRLPCHGPGKGVMSGNTAFTKSTFLRSGGVDPWFLGHGAWADSSYHAKCHDMGMEMIDLGVLELHLYHEKLFGNDQVLTRKELEILSLINYVYYCSQWGLSFDRCRQIAANLKLRPGFVAHVKRLVREGRSLEWVKELNRRGFDSGWEDRLERS